MNQPKLYSILVEMVSNINPDVRMQGEICCYDHFTIRAEECHSSLKHDSHQSKITSVHADRNKIQTIISQYTTDTAEYQLGDIKRIGHRGNGANKGINQIPRENTIDSFLLAHSRGAQMIELDIQLTADKQLVVFHNHAIRDKLVAEMTYWEFMLESSSSSDDFRSTCTILENILESLPDDLAIYLEIKYESRVENYPANYANEVVERTLDLVRKYPKKKILFASFSPYVCALIKTCCPSYKVSFLMCDSTLVYVSKEKLVDTIAKFVTDCNIDGIGCDTDFYPEVEELFVKMEGKIKLLYGKGTNDLESLERFRKLGFDVFCTDNLTIHQSNLISIEE